MPQSNITINNEQPITAEQSMQLLQVQKDILEIAINDNNHQATLDTLCLAAEGIIQNSIACIMLFDEQENSLTVRAAPNLCQRAIEQMNQLKPGEHTGSCGASVYRASPQFVDDTSTDKRWHELVEFANTFNIHACWSIPIMSNDKKVMGTFAILGLEKGAPCIFQQNLLQTASYLAALLLNREAFDLALT